ncbi:hypothetical protein Tco_1447101 [Tanacetum coccineum]
MDANKSFNRNPANHRLYHALIEALIEDENTMDKGVTDTVKDHKRKHDDDEDDDDEDPPAGPNQGKKTKRRRTKESGSSKKPSSTKETPKGKTPTKGFKTGKSALAKEPVEEPIVEVIMDDAADDLQPPRPLTPDPDWNKRQCYNALTEKLDWNNLEGDHYPFDLSKPLPLQGPLGHQTIAADYFFNNDLEYLKTSDPESVGAEVEHPEPGFELQGAKMVETGSNSDDVLSLYYECGGLETRVEVLEALDDVAAKMSHQGSLGLHLDQKDSKQHVVTSY